MQSFGWLAGGGLHSGGWRWGAWGWAGSGWLFFCCWLAESGLGPGLEPGAVSAGRAGPGPRLDGWLADWLAVDMASHWASGKFGSGLRLQRSHQFKHQVGLEAGFAC